MKLLENKITCWPARAGLFLVLLGFWLAPGNALAVRFTAALDRDTVTLGENAQLTLAFEDGSPKNIPSFPAIPNLNISYIGPETQMSWVNGQMSSSTKYHFSVTPTAVGEYTIPSLQVEVGGQKLSSPALKFKVVKDTAAVADASGSENQLAFFKIAVPKKQVYVGEVIPLEMHLYLNAAVQGANIEQLSQIKADGFTVGKVVKGQERRVRVGNGTFTVVPLVLPLAAVKPGSLAVGPVDCMVSVQLPNNNRRRNDPFDFPDPFGVFNRGEVRRVTVSAEPETIEVRSLPAQNVPPAFNGAVGDYTMHVTASPTTVTAGDPVTVQIQISGRGAIDSLALPAQPGWDQFKTYPPNSKVETEDPLGLQGTKTFEQIIAPQSADIKELPPVTFSYFDPEKNAYRTLTHPAIPLAVRAGAPSSAPTIVSATQTESAPPAQELIPIKRRLGNVNPTLLVRQPGFIAVQTIPLLAWMGLLLRRRHQEKLANNPRLRRRREVEERVRTGLETLRGHAMTNHSDEFFATLFRLLQEQIGDRLDLPASSITENVIEQHLRPRGVDEQTLNYLQELFYLCDAARYAPVQTSRELAAVIPRFEHVVEDLKGME